MQPSDQKMVARYAQHKSLELQPQTIASFPY